jgi:hypothetical protein
VKRLHRLGRWAGLVACAAIAVTMTGAPANASVAQGLVAGSGVITDDWGDEGPMSRTRHAYSGATGMWQRVLYADGAIERDGTTFDQNDMDCDFGPNTEAATRNWQARHSLSADGIVGPITLSTADNKLSIDGNSTVYYHGSAHTVQLGSRLAFPGTGWYFIHVPWGQGADFEAGYGPPDYTPAPGGPPRACW